MQQGDVIVDFDNQQIASIDELHRLLTEKRVKARSLLTIIRRSEKLVLDTIPQEAKTKAHFLNNETLTFDSDITYKKERAWLNDP